MSITSPATLSAHDLLGLRTAAVRPTTSPCRVRPPTIISLSSRRPTPSATPAFSCMTTGPLLPDTLKLGLGVRWDHASRNGSYVSPNATLLWTPSRSDSSMHAQAPRTVARAEQDVSVFLRRQRSATSAASASRPLSLPSRAARRVCGRNAPRAWKSATASSSRQPERRYQPVPATIIPTCAAAPLTSINGCSPLFAGLGSPTRRPTRLPA